MRNEITMDDLARAYEQTTGKLYHACTECECDPEYVKWIEKELIEFINNSIYTIEMCKIINEDES